MNKNLLLFELRKLDTWTEHLVMEYKGIEKAVWEEIEGCCVQGWSVWWSLLCFQACLMQRHFVPIYRIQHGINFLHVNGKDWMVNGIFGRQCLPIILNYWRFVLNLHWSHVKSETVLSNNGLWTVVELLSWTSCREQCSRITALMSCLEQRSWIIVLMSCPEQ